MSQLDADHMRYLDNSLKSWDANLVLGPCRCEYAGQDFPDPSHLNERCINRCPMQYMQIIYLKTFNT